MTRVGDHWDDEGGGKYLKEGWHNVRITGFRLFEYHSGNPGVEFDVEGEHEAQSSLSFVLCDTAIWKLTQFCKCCGMTRKEASTYDPYNERHHKKLVNRKFCLNVIAEEKADKKTGEIKTYHRGVDFAAVEKDKSKFDRKKHDERIAERDAENPAVIPLSELGPGEPGDDPLDDNDPRNDNEPNDEGDDDGNEPPPF